MATFRYFFSRRKASFLCNYYTVSIGRHTLAGASITEFLEASGVRAKIDSLERQTIHLNHEKWLDNGQELCDR